ncbi:MAG: hydantoinase B/oxoprolinase family protein [Candidatus Hadarchaeales archaeon]
MPSEKKGIGWGGKTLLEMLEESEKKFEETGSYYGLNGKLMLFEKDPFLWMQTFSMLRGALVTARETAMHISASPIVRSIGELAFVLYTPEGDSIAHSTGILVHVHTMSETIKFMIRNDYESDPGIEEGDIFACNDPSIGNVHTTDVHTIIPIFYKGELVSWVGGVTHEVDIGGIVPGHDLYCTTSRFEDGFILTAEKIGSKDKVRRDHRIKAARSTRAPLYYELDEKCRIAGCFMVREAVLRIIEERGIDYYKQFIREAVERGRLDFIGRVKERLVPGRYRAAAFVDMSSYTKEAWQPQAKKDILSHAPQEIQIRADGTLYLDMDGSTGTLPVSWNAGPAPMQGGLWVLMTQMVNYDAVINDGAYLALKTNFPPRTWTNPQDPLLSYQCPWGPLMAAYTCTMRSLGRGFFARGFLEEALTGYPLTADCTQGGGVLSGEVFGEPSGMYFPIATFEISCTGLGASAVKDGVDWSYAMWNPEGDMGDAEDLERLERGFRFLGRRVMPNTAGYGKYRGGSGWEVLRVLYGIRKDSAILFSGGAGYVFTGCGVHGGYPPPTGFKVWARKTDIKERWNKKLPYPLGERDPEDSEIEKNIKGEIERLDYVIIYPRVFDEGDIFHYFIYGGPGYGDPLERDIKLVEKDLNEGIYTEDIVRRVYGVVAEKDEEGRWRVVEQATEELRAQMRKKRAERSISFQEFYERERKKITEGKLIEPVKNMYRESIALSKRWGKEFLEFWQIEGI